MPDPLAEPPATDVDALAAVMRAAEGYLPSLSDAGAAGHPAGTPPGLPRAPDDGLGTMAALETLIGSALAGATPTTGPRYFDFVIGGATPAAMAADWLTSLVDQNAAGPGSAAWATNLEAIVLAQLVSLFDLPDHWSGVLTTTSMMASFTALACATQAWARAHGVDYAKDGLTGLPRLTVFAGPMIHPTARKALQMLGHGRSCVIELGGPDSAVIDVVKLDRALTAVDGPAVVVATAGDASGGRFEPIAQVADVTQRHRAWLHVDGAFGLYVALAQSTRSLVCGIERADSIAADAHKWMNTPYDSGFCLVADPSALEPSFGMPSAPYLPPGEDGFRGFSVLGPDSSRRARALPIWASLAAYGPNGLAAMVERHLDIARHLARRIDREPELELLLEPVSCVVCFRWVPPARDRATYDDANRRLAETITQAGRFGLGTTTLAGSSALRAALCNWRVQRTDADELVDHVLAAARQLTS
jgi:glutamate/tyrosine decarboxylase-like PLP-dependent enzyme